MEKFSINILGNSVNYISEINILDYFINKKDFMEFYNAKVEPFIEDDNVYTIEYHDVKNANNVIEIINNKMIVNYPKENLTESIIVYLGMHFFEKQFGNKGICSLHSSCVEKNGVATLFIGDAGAGKTSLAINLCYNHGYRLISNDMTLVGIENNQLCAYQGTKFINLRLTSVKQNMPFLLELFHNKEKDEWTNKVPVLAENIGLKTCNDIIPIQNIFCLHIDNNIPLKVTNGNTWRNNFLLYQNSSSHIRGTAATFIDKTGYPIGYIPSFDDKKTYDLRCKIIGSINSSENYYNVSGSMQEVIDFTNIINEKNKVLRRIK